MNYSWEKIVSDLMLNFQQNQLAINAKLPSENKLAEKYQVSRIIIRKSYAYLKDLGYIYSLQGKGNFFKGIPDKIPLNLSDHSSFSLKMKIYGPRFATNMICAFDIKDEFIAQKLHIAPDDKILQIKRVRLLDHQPIALHISYLAAKHFPTLQANIHHFNSLYIYLKHEGYHDFIKIKQILTLEYLNDELRELLQLNTNASTICVTSEILLSQTNKIYEYSKIFYRADKFSFDL